MIARIQLVCLILAIVDGEEADFLEEEVGLVRDGLRAYGVGQMPSVVDVRMVST